MKRKIGLIVVFIGILHTLLAFVKFSSTFGKMISEALLNTGAGAERGWAIWFATTGFAFILLGLSLNYIEQQNLKIPDSLGFGFFLIAIIGGILIPISGFWALLLPATLIFLSKKQ